MKTLQRVLPIVAALAAIGGAICYVCTQGPVRPAMAEVTKMAVSPGHTLPPSDRYAGNRGVAN
jgi:hypothetical protein